MNYVLKYPGSALLYIFILILSLCCAYFGSSSAQRLRSRINIWIILLIGILSIFAGIRNEVVGVDLAHYIIRYIEPIKEGYFSYITDMSIGFKVFVWIVYLFTDQTFIVVTMISLLTNTLIVLRLWDFRNKSSFTMMIFWYYCLYYLVTFNIFRQFMAVAIVFYFTRFLENKNYKTFLIGVIIATTIHNVSILGFAYLPIYILLSNESKQEKKVKNIFLLVSPLLILVTAFVLYRFYDFDHYIDLLNRSTNKGLSGISVPIKIILGIYFFRVVKKCIVKSNVTQNEWFKWGFIYLLGLLIGISAYISFEAERFTFYFILFEIPFVSVKCKKNSKLRILKFIYCVFAIYSLYSKLAGGGSQIMPYLTFWQ